MSRTAGERLTVAEKDIEAALHKFIETHPGIPIIKGVRNTWDAEDMIKEVVYKHKLSRVAADSIRTYVVAFITGYEYSQQGS